MAKVFVFGGTVDGREVAAFLAAHEVQTVLQVATDYGEELAESSHCLIVRAGRLQADEMVERTKGYDLVIDATHPYAQEVTPNIKKAASVNHTEYLRLLRPVGDTKSAQIVSTIAQAAKILEDTTGNVLITTGSKELHPYMALDTSRLFVRVLPTVFSIEACRRANIPSKNIIAMQGPFTKQINEAMLLQINASYLVTKESGAAGGYAEKMEAAEAAGAAAIVVGREQEQEGYTLQELKQLLAEKLKLQKERQTYMFPLFINLSKKKIVAFGGGRIATRRVQTLQALGATDITVISPHVSGWIEAQDKRVTHKKREYTAGDCSGADIVLAATDSRKINAAIGKECKKQNIPVSVADCKEECTFYFPAIIQADNMVAGLCSDGSDQKKVKQIAARMRQVLQET